ncbi:uncharacterized protein LOC129570372 [Sitodiplosis mosellana]|uniref:uncharacterized protein LOC129570372 n=1 Tax=Sitodiplosis mosellana TaxID=263140 RepID=UPI00244500D1|nr:uncharacterized protein LOC129570372 [Sitodiplosis mosellana]
MSTNIGDELDELYETHQTNIENELQQMVTHFESSANGSNRANMKSFFDSLGHRTRGICQSVRAKCIAEMIGQQKDGANMNDELDEDDFDQITNLLEQIDDLENDDVEMIDRDKEPPAKMNEAKLEVFSQGKVNAVQIEKAGVIPSSKCSPSFQSNAMVSGASIDHFLQFQRIHTNTAITKNRRCSMFQERAPLFGEAAARISKMRRLTMVNEDRPGPGNQNTKSIKWSNFVLETIKLHSQKGAILNAKCDASGQIQTFCFFCNRKLKMALCDWKSHYLKHTEEEEFYCTGCNAALASTGHEHCMGYHVAESFANSNELNAFMCIICNYLQVNQYRVIEHIKREHANEPPDDHMKKVLLLPDLQRRTTPIPAEFACVSVKNRYQCSARSCKLAFQQPANFKKHFMVYHKTANKVVCPHCGEVMKRDESCVDFFGVILNHCYMHGTIVDQCHICDMIFPNDFNILSHFLGKHDRDVCRYRRDFRNAKEIDRMEEVLVVFECNLCQIRVDTSSQAVQHFVKSHKSHHADFTLIQFVKETNFDGVTKYVTSEIGQVWKFQKHFVCGWCNELFITKDRLNRHHELVHKSQYLRVEFTKNHLIDLNKTSKVQRQNLAIDQYLMYYCAYCSDLDHSISTFYASIDEVYDHWSESHDKSRDPKPFRFTVAQLARCRYCDVFSTFAGMKKHEAEQHPTKPFVFEDLIDRMKCGLCLDRGEGNLVKHFDTNHQAVLKANLFNPIALNGDVLKKLVNLKGHKKRKCTHCADVFEMKNEFYRHHDEKHASLRAESDKIYDNESIHLIAGCCEARIQPEKLFAHFKEHNIASKYRLKTYYWETKVIFGNGLVLNKHNLIGSENDDSKEFENFIKTTMDGK